MKDFYYQIYKFGDYYNPASKHYETRSNYNVINVICDRCGRKNLNICIGYNDYDLCIPCVDELDRTYKNESNKIIYPNYSQDLPFGPVLTPQTFPSNAPNYPSRIVTLPNFQHEQPRTVPLPNFQHEQPRIVPFGNPQYEDMPPVSY